MNATPTQVAYPWRAALRTALAYIVGASVVLPIAYRILAEQLGQYLPPDVLAGLAWTVGLLVAAATTVTRVMAIPAVNDWLTKVGAGARPAEPYTPERALPDDNGDDL